MEGKKTTWREATRQISWHSWEQPNTSALVSFHFSGTSCPQYCVLGVIPLSLSHAFPFVRSQWRVAEQIESGQQEETLRNETRRDETERRATRRANDECLTNAFSCSLKVNTLNSSNSFSCDREQLSPKMGELSNWGVWISVTNKCCIRKVCFAYGKSRFGSVELIEMIAWGSITLYNMI